MKKLIVIDDSDIIDVNVINFSKSIFDLSERFEHIKYLNDEYYDMFDENDYTILEDAACVMLHKSHEYSHNILRYMNNTNVSYVLFTGDKLKSEYELCNIESCSCEIGVMNKYDFYQSFENFLMDYEINKIPNLEKLVRGGFLEAPEVGEKKNYGSVETWLHISEKNRPNKTLGAAGIMEMRNFLISLKDDEGVVFDMDEADNGKTLMPVSARYVALYIRLSRYDLKDRALVPLLFRTSKSAAELTSEFMAAGVADILMCEGSYIVDRDYKALFPSDSDGFRAVAPDNYRKGFLDRIKVMPNALVGNHTIANDWGAYIMAKMTIKDLNQKYKYDVMSKDPLYLLYLLRCRENGDENYENKDRNVIDNPLKGHGKKILLIDDQDKEWRYVLENLFKGVGEIDVWGTSTGHIESKKDPMRGYLSQMAWDKLAEDVDKYDLVLLDLRLGGIAEETLQGEGLSGLKVLNRIMEINRGQRVIVMTSSNKVWNLKKALEDGAASFYLKESPLISKSNEESRNNINQFCKDINYCFDNAFLKQVMYDYDFIEHKWHIRKICNKTVESYGDRIDVHEQENLVRMQMKIAVDMLFKAVSSPEDKRKSLYEHAYIAIEQILEIMKQWDPDYDYKISNINVYVGRVTGKIADDFYPGDDIYSLNTEEVDFYNQAKEFTNLRNKIVHNVKWQLSAMVNGRQKRIDLQLIEYDVFRDQYVIPFWKFMMTCLKMVN